MVDDSLQVLVYAVWIWGWVGGSKLRFLFPLQNVSEVSSRFEKRKTGFADQM